jgi:hypothetical protein
MRNSILNYRNPADATLETVMPGMNNRLNLLLSEVRHGRQQVEKLNERFDNFVSEYQQMTYGLHQHFCDSQISTRTMYAQSLRSLADQLDTPVHFNNSSIKELATGAHHSIVQRSNKSVPAESPRPEMGSMIPLGFNHALQEKHVSVQDMYDKWFGLGTFVNVPVEGGINGMEAKYKSLWRRDFSTANSKRFSRLKNVVNTLLLVVAESDSQTIKEVITMFT